MTIQRIALLVASLVAVLASACAPAPSAGTGGTATPTASPSLTASAQPTASPTVAPSATATPGSAYLDDRSSAEQVIRSYYDAISRRQTLRAYAYWEPSTTLPPYDTFAKGFADTTSAQVELGTVGGGTGAGQLYWSVPAAITSTTSAGPQSFVGCYTLHLGRPEIQTAPPFKPIAIQSAQVSAVANAAAAHSGLATVCGTANATPLPWGAAGAGIDATHYVDDRSAGEQVIQSYYNAVNRKEYSRSYGYWESGATGLAPFDTFAAGYTSTKSVALMTTSGTTDAGAGQLYYSIPAVVTASNADGSTTIFSGCYKLHLGSPNIQATPPFQPLGIQSARIAQAAAGASASSLLSSACP
jgi:hypothetical protein